MEKLTRRAGARAVAVSGLIVAGWVPAATLTLDISHLHAAQGGVTVPQCGDGCSHTPALPQKQLKRELP
jgi:hypothetical protein